jgi:type IV secretory pathway VirB2 component (pilin)
MNSTRIALYAALAAAAGWTAKSIAIGTAGGLGKSPLEGPLFFVGLACFVVAVVALGVAMTRGRPSWLRAVVGVVGFVVFFQCSMLLDTLIDRTLGGTEADRHWAWTEVTLWISVVIVLVAAVGQWRRSSWASSPRGSTA